MVNRLKRAEPMIPRKLGGRLGCPLAGSAGGVEAATLGPQDGPPVYWFVTLSSGADRSRIRANVFGMSCSLAPVTKIFWLRFKSEGQGTPQVESSLVISLTSPQNTGALGPQ